MRVAESQVNGTPFEPERERFVTLNISDTTPLPAKVYANEGCARYFLPAPTRSVRSAALIARATIRNSRGLFFPSFRAWRERSGRAGWHGGLYLRAIREVCLPSARRSRRSVLAGALG